MGSNVSVMNESMDEMTYEMNQYTMMMMIMMMMIVILLHKLKCFIGISTKKTCDSLTCL